MAEVIELNVVTKLDIPADRVLQKAIGRLESVVLCGYDKSGNEFFASSIADGGTTLWLLERCKKQLLEVPERPEYSGGAA